MKPSSTLSRRAFAGSLGAGLLAAQPTPERPNILWITCEDIGPHLGCYGDPYATTPHLDRFASRSLRYLNAWSTAPVCAPARTTIISGLYPPSTGAEHMRSLTRLPEGFRMYPCYLRDAGYYAANNSKEDYNLEHTGDVWDESSNRAHWRNRKPGQSFFAIFNFTITHESQIRTRPHKAVHDPAQAPIPAYHPDTPEVRQDWAQYYDNITTMDEQAAGVLKQLEEDGLAGDTIVFFYGDHGSGMPRSKRWPYNSGLRVPLLVHVPEKWRRLAPPGYRPGGTTDRLVGFIDLAPAVLSLAAVRPPAHMQGHAFCGRFTAPEQPFAYGFRGRMDERYDMVRAVRDKRYLYIRNYMPHKVYGQYLNYMFQTPTTRVWKELYDQGKLQPPQTYFWETKPPEELYDLASDPDEVRNLAGDPAMRRVLERLRKAERDQAVRIRDVGFLPEDEIHSRATGATPYEAGRRYPVERVVDTAQAAASLSEQQTPALVRALGDGDSAVRYWGAMGLLMRGAGGLLLGRAALEKALEDTAPSVRIAAAEALGRYGTETDAARVLPVLMELAPMDRNGLYVSIQALNAIDALGKRANPVRDAVARLPRSAEGVPQRLSDYVPRLIERITGG